MKNTVIKNWVFDVKKVLIDLGFFYLWTNQKNNGILQLVKQRIFDQAKQDIFANVENSKKCSFYKYLFDGIHLQYYLRKPIPIKLQKYITKLRLSSHRLAIETGRYNNTNRENRLCPHCKTSVEDEFHFLFLCPLYINIAQIIMIHARILL